MVSSCAPEVLDVLELLVERAPDTSGALTVGAGPLENLIHEHGDRLVDELESRARRSPLFAAALASVWLEDGHLQATTVERLSPWLDRS